MIDNDMKDCYNEVKKQKGEKSMSKTMKVILIVIIVVAIILGLIKWIVFPIIIQKQGQAAIGNVETKMDSAVVEAFNAQFTSYVGSGISGRNVKTLIQNVLINNRTNDTLVAINFNGTKYSGDSVSSVSILISSSSTYTVTLNYGSMGYVESISIN